MRSWARQRIALSVLLALTAASYSISSENTRLGFVGTGGLAFAQKFGLEYYTLEGNHPASGGTTAYSLDSAFDPPAGLKVVREVAKLNERKDGLGESNAEFKTKLKSYATAMAKYRISPWTKKPSFSWYAPDPAKLVAAESSGIRSTVKRELTSTPLREGTLWEIGNEPNLFPAITPNEYANLYAAYHQAIRSADATAKIVMGSLFVPEVAEDLKAKLKDELTEQIRAEMITAGLYNTLNSMGVFQTVVNDVYVLMTSRILALSTSDYLSQVLAALPSGVVPDYISLHIYPYDDRAPFIDANARRTQIASVVAAVQSSLASKGMAAPILITEFGNISQGKSESDVANLVTGLVGDFASTPGIEKWFYYKPTGADAQFALFSTGEPPLAHLGLDASFSPANGDFKCVQLNAVGLALYLAQHGKACADPKPDTITISPPKPDTNIASGPSLPKLDTNTASGPSLPKPDTVVAATPPKDTTKLIPAVQEPPPIPVSILAPELLRPWSQRRPWMRKHGSIETRFDLFSPPRDILGRPMGRR